MTTSRTMQQYTNGGYKLNNERQLIRQLMIARLISFIENLFFLAHFHNKSLYTRNLKTTVKQLRSDQYTFPPHYRLLNLNSNDFATWRSKGMRHWSLRPYCKAWFFRSLLSQNGTAARTATMNDAEVSVIRNVLENSPRPCARVYNHLSSLSLLGSSSRSARDG